MYPVYTLFNFLILNVRVRKPQSETRYFRKIVTKHNFFLLFFSKVMRRLIKYLVTTTIIHSL